MTSLLTFSASNSLPRWQPATWDDYLQVRDRLPEGSASFFFNQGYLLVEMGEGLDHASFNFLMGLVFFIWFTQKSPQTFHVLNGCLMEKRGQQAASPDLVLYLGDDFPKRQEGESRYLNLNQWRVPNLVGEIGDTTIASDLDEKKQLYAALEIPEYWVVDVKAARVLAFQLDDSGKYQQVEVSGVLAGLPIELLSQTLEKLNQGMPNGAAAQWFSQQIATLEK